jgi:TonB family protein
MLKKLLTILIIIGCAAGCGKRTIPPPGTYIPHNVNPVLLKSVTPAYPESARQSGIEGTVYVWMFINTNGRVIKVAVAKSAGNASLDSAATAAAGKFTFSSARQGDKPVGVWVSLPFRFTLEQKQDR